MVPSCPAESISTLTAFATPVATPRIPAIASVAKERFKPNGRVSVDIGTIGNEGERPEAVLLLPIVLLKSALSPTAVLEMPSVLLKRANAPLAVFPKAVLLLKSAPVPVAVFSSAVLARSVAAPIAVLKWRP
jgi:hypothetical protein